MKTTVIYLAARYSRRLELCGYREQLRVAGFNVQARWLNGDHQLSNNGVPIGESGEVLVERNDAQNAELRAKFANDDWEDVTSANLVISFTESPRSEASRGGRHVEFGIAMGRGTSCVVVGYRENIFHWLPSVRFFATWTEAFSNIASIFP